MLHEGKLELQSGGVLASLNYLGYFLGAVTCAAIRVKPATMVRSGLVATAALLLGMGLLHGFTAWGVLRTAAGVMSAWVFVFASGWGLRRLAETNAPALGGVIYTGPGIGIAVTGLLGGAVGRYGSDAGWIGFGIVALVLIAVIWRVFDDGAVPLGTASSVAAPAAADSAAARRDATWLVSLYGLAGFGYIITATFLPVIARQAMPGSPWPDFFWPLFGAAIIPGALIGARAPSHWDNRLLLAIAYLLQAAGVVLSVVWTDHCGFRVGEPSAGHAVHDHHAFRGARGAAPARQCGGRADRLRHRVLRGRADPGAALCGTAGSADGLFRRAAFGCSGGAGARIGAFRARLGPFTACFGLLTADKPFICHGKSI